MSSDRDVSRARYGLFLGAGASAAFAQFLLEEGNNLNSQASLLPTSREFLNHLSDVIESSSVTSPAVKLWGDLSTLGHDNIELLMRDIDSLEQGLGVFSRLKSLDPWSGISHKMESRCQELRDLIHQEIQNCYKLPYGETIDDLVARFFHPIVLGLDSAFDAPVNSDVMVITTNIDTVIERYARSAIGKQRFSLLLDGFSSADPVDQRVWEDNFRVGPSNRNRDRGCLVLVKLHGSINWCSDEEAEKVLSLPISLPSSVTYKIDKSGSMFLYPAYEKDIVGKRIYSDLFYHLDEYIYNIPNWVFAGFAFKDAWVNNALEHSLCRSRPKKNLVIVNPSISSEDLPEALRRARQMELGLEELRQAYSPLLDIEPERKAVAASARSKASVAASGSISMKLSRPNLVAYWRLTSESVNLENRLAVDIGPNNLDGIISGAEFRSRPGLFFDGIRSSVDIGSHEDLIGSTQMTILARVFLTGAVGKRDQVILASQGESDIDFIFGVAPDNRLFLEPNPWPHMFDLALSDSKVPKKSDHWVGVTADWTGKTELQGGFYLDGVLVGKKHLQPPGEMHPLFANQPKVPNSVSIGASIPSLDMFSGFLRDVQLYNAVLPAATIEELHRLS